MNNDGIVDVLDMFCVLGGLAGVFTLSWFANVDISPCEGDGAVDVFDIFGVLDAFAGD